MELLDAVIDRCADILERGADRSLSGSKMSCRPGHLAPQRSRMSAQRSITAFEQFHQHHLAGDVGEQERASLFSTSGNGFGVS